MRVTVTGGTGFIGSYVVEQLLRDGHELTLLARDPRKVTGQQDRDGIAFVRGAIDDRAAVRESLRGADAVVHIARAKAPGGSDALLADTLPTVQLFEDAVAAGVRRFLYTSSIAVFDDRADDQFTDESAQRPINVYGATKAAAEAYLVGMALGSGVRVTAIRPGYTFGNPIVKGAVTQAMPELPRIARSAAAGTDIAVDRNAGLQFIWAGDLATVYSAALTSGLDRRYYTALSPEFYTWESIAHWAIEATGSSSTVVVSDTGRGPRTPPWGVASIEHDFGLRFTAEQRLREHLAYLATAP